MSSLMIDFHSYLLANSPGSRALAEVSNTQAASYQFPYYRQYVTVLCQYDIFLLQGRDTLDFLQGQLCGDVRQLSQEQALWTAHCSPKGRVYSTLLLTQQGESVLALSPQSNATELIERLRKYILFSKLTITSPETKPYLIECSGPDTAKALAGFFPQLPEKSMEMTATEELQVLRLHGEQPRWLIITTDEAAAIAIWDKLAPTHCPIYQETHQRLSIDAGLVEVGKELQEAFLPQMIGLERFGAMSLKKGCYVGQEVIARTSNLGKLKRRLYYAMLSNDKIPAIGQSIEDSSGSALGTCVGACRDEDSNTVKLLAVLSERGLSADLFCDGIKLQAVELTR
jgi:tRNA-modifying protein YgfZ